MRFLCFLAVAACGNSLAPPGKCEVATNGAVPEVTPVALAGHPTGFDDLRFSPQLGKVLALPEASGRLFVIDPDSLDVAQIGVPGGSESADASATTLYVLDRTGSQIIAFDAATSMRKTARTTTGSPDYVRFAPTANEVWVTIPSRNRIEILDGETLSPVGNVELPGAPEGLTFDSTGTAFTQASGSIVQVDVARRLVVGEWGTGCSWSHGFPQVDEAYGLAIGGCSSSGGISVTQMGGGKLAGFEAGGGSAILAHDGTKHHLFVRGDPSTTLDILAVCPDGGTSVLAKVPITHDGHGATVDDRGHAWVCDGPAGGVLRITDPFPANPESNPE